MYMTEAIDMQAKMDGGLLGGLKRKFLAGESLFITDFRATAAGRKLAFAGPYPGKIIHIRCRPADALPAGRVSLRHRRRRPQRGVHEAAGCRFLRRRRFHPPEMEGTGDLFIHSGGTIVALELREGERLRVDTGCLVALDPTVDYDIERVGGISTSLFGGEGLFFASLTGPGRVWLQTLPFSRLAERIHQAYRGDREDVKRDFGGTLGAIGDLIGGRD